MCDCKPEAPRSRADDSGKRPVASVDVPIATEAPATPDYSPTAPSPPPGAAAAAAGAGPSPEEEARLAAEAAARASVAAAEAALLAADPALPTHPLAALNAAAAARLRAGDAPAAAALFGLLFARAARANLTHPDLHVARANAATAALRLGLHEEALAHAERARAAAEAALARGPRAGPSLVRALERKGEALLGLRRHREASAAFDAALRADPLAAAARRGLEAAAAGTLRDLAEGRGRETRAIAWREAPRRVTRLPHSAPLHAVRAEDELPAALLTPFQAENDAGIKDTYNYMTVQADVRAPARALAALADARATAAWAAAVAGAVADVEAGGADARVLVLGGGAGLAALAALRAGARHVTLAQPRLYLALAAREALAAAGFSEDRWRVVAKRPTDLRLLADVPVCANVVVVDLLDEGLLTSGLLPAAAHALAALAAPAARVLPAAATAFVQAAELRTPRSAGLDLSAADRFRAHPTHLPADAAAVVPLSPPVEAWHFDLGAPPDRAAAKEVDLTFARDGRWNAVRFWFRLRLFGEVYLNSGPEEEPEALGGGGFVAEGGASAGAKGGSGSCAAVKPPPRAVGPALQYLPGELAARAGEARPLLARHNTVRLRFDVAAAEYLRLAKADAAFPPAALEQLSDGARLAAYGRALERAVQRIRAADGECHVLDVGAGGGALALLAARAGADSVVAAELSEPLCAVARAAAAANGLSSRVSVVQRDVGLLQRGHDVRALGVNLVVADLFDAGLFGDGAVRLLELARRRAARPGAAAIPAAATLYACGVEALTGSVEGFDFSALDRYRWADGYEAVRLEALPHRRLTAPVRVLEHFFDGRAGPRAREGVLRLPVVAAGTLNAVAFWFDLHLDDVETLSNGGFEHYQCSAERSCSAG
jgi:protein arginine N-methyltransferase 7